MKTKYMLGIGIAVALVITLAVAGLSGANSPSPTSSTASTSQGATASSLSTSHTVSAGQSSTSAASSTGGGATSSQDQTGNSGDFAMMATDPPIAASGVSSATVTYNGLAVHSAGSSSASGWTEIDASGTINLMSSVNVSQTIASTQVQSGTYDMVAMNVTSGTVVYNGQTYTAAIASGNMRLNLNSDVQVNSSTSSAAIVDLRTFIVNAGNASNPQFVISASAKATAVPASDVTTASLQVGSTFSLQGQAWWTTFQTQTTTNVSIISATLNADSLSLKLGDSGDASGDVQTVVVTPVSAGATATASLPASLSGSAVFTVSGSGSAQESNTLEGAMLLNSTGTIVSAGSTTSVDFTGTISLSFGSGVIQVSGVIPGQTYLITVMGANTFANAVVVAQ
jgi:hypothetical protein